MPHLKRVSAPPDKCAHKIRGGICCRRLAAPPMGIKGMRDNMNITLHIENDLSMVSSRARVGHQGDHQFTTFLIDRPDFLANFSCRAELRAGTASGFIDVDSNSFTLPSSLTRAGNLELQLVFTNDQNEVIAKTSIVRLSIGNSIDATESAEIEFPNGGAVDLSGIESRLTALESALTSILNSISALLGRADAVENDISAINNDLISISDTATQARSIADLAAIKAATAGDRAEEGIRRADSAQTAIDDLTVRVSALEP